MTDTPIDSFCESNSKNNDDLSLLLSNLKLDDKKTFKMPDTAVVPVLDMQNLSIIPKFDGNVNKLFRFINATESILNHFYDRQNLSNFQNVLLMNGILNKLEGRAEEVVAITGANSWDDIKKTLIDNFGDQRDENCLNQDLVNLKQKTNETPYQFHERVIHLLNTICNYVDLHSQGAERTLKRDFFTKQGLKSFLAGLKEPLGPIIRAMRPTTLEQAVQFIREEDNIKYYQKSQTPNNYTKPTNSHNFQAAQALRPPPVNRFSNQFNQNQSHRNQMQIQKFSNPPHPNFSTHTQSNGRPQNVWSPNSNIVASQPKPTPMSVSTRNTQLSGRNQNYNHFQNRTQKPPVKCEELFVTEFENPEANNEPAIVENYDEQNYECMTEDQDENFWELCPPDETP